MKHPSPRPPIHDADVKRLQQELHDLIGRPKQSESKPREPSITAPQCLVVKAK
jgi:hypothetical protein